MINGVKYSLQVADINIGVLYLFGVVSIGVYGIMIGGWASNNKYSLLGALRASSQMISYEVASICAAGHIAPPCRLMTSGVGLARL